MASPRRLRKPDTPRRLRQRATEAKRVAAYRAERADVMQNLYWPTVNEAFAMMERSQEYLDQPSAVLPSITKAQAKEIYSVCLRDMRINGDTKLRKEQWRIVRNLHEDFGDTKGDGDGE